MKKEKDYKQQVEDYIEEKRKDFIKRNNFRQNLISSIEENFKIFNIKAVQIGKNVINLEDMNIDFQSTADENEILQSIHVGEKIFLLSVTNMSCGYFGKENVHIENQKIENLSTT